MLVNPAPKVWESLAERGADRGWRLPDLQVSGVYWLSPSGYLRLNHNCLLVSGASKSIDACVSPPETDFLGLGCGLRVGGNYGRSPGDSSMQTSLGITVWCCFLYWLVSEGRWWKIEKNPGLVLRHLLSFYGKQVCINSLTPCKLNSAQVPDRRLWKFND